ncbi:MAG: methylated-DNA--[protein]-cysteine S-methyltransferase [Caulobacterales bacterium]
MRQARGKFPGMRRERVDFTHEEICYGLDDCSWGAVLVARSEIGIISVMIGEDDEENVRDLRRRFPEANLIRTKTADRTLPKPIIEFLEKPKALDLPLDMRGTEFQKKVWNAVRKVKLGQTSNYSEIAHRIGRPRAARAIGTACAQCELSFLIPCHRILHKDGSMSGFWPEEKQRRLLEREAEVAIKLR